MTREVLLSLGLTAIVGLTMGIGGGLAFFINEKNKKFFSLSLSFSAGIMIYAAFMAILPEGMHHLEEYFGDMGKFIGLIGFFGGMIVIALIEKWVHRHGGDHGHDHGPVDHDHAHEGEEKEGHLSKLGLMSAIAIGIHNLPEGLTIFTTGLNDISVAIPIALAVILHNIPLGIAISVPIYYSTGSKRKALVYSFLVGLCQPLGAIIGYLLFANIETELFIGILYTVVSGIMIFISLDELLPSSQKDNDHHISVYGAIAGMMIMALSLSIFKHSH